jgi:hypothetical protein
MKQGPVAGYVCLCVCVCVRVRAREDTMKDVNVRYNTKLTSEAYTSFHLVSQQAQLRHETSKQLTILSLSQSTG